MLDGLAPKDAIPFVLSKSLSRALVTHRRLPRQPSLVEWAREFDRLVRKVPHKRVERVLKYFETTLDKPYHVRAYSAHEFARKFDQIEAAMTASEARARDQDTDVPPEVERIVARLTGDRQWPVEVQALLGPIVHKSRLRLRDFAERVKAVREVASDRDRGFLDMLLELKLFPGVIEWEWMPLQYERVGRLEHHTGDPMALAFDPRGELFRQSLWHSWARNWCGAWWAFDHLLGEVNG